MRLWSRFFVCGLAAAALGCAAYAVAAPSWAHAQTAADEETEDGPGFFGWLFGEERQRIKAVEAADSETQTRYTAAIEGAPSDDIDATARAALRVFQLQPQGAPSFALLKRRAEADTAQLKRLLRSEGYYEPDVTVEVTQTALDAAESEERRRPRSQERAAQVLFVVEPGPRYALAAHDFTPSPEAEPVGAALDAAALAAGGYGAEVGAPAVAAEIVSAEAAAAVALRREGYPYAEVKGRRAVANRDQKTLSVTSYLDSGPRTVFGPIVIEGLEQVEADYVLTYAPWREGDLFDESALTLFQRFLSQTDLFDAVSVKKPEAPPAPGPNGVVIAPITVRAEEGLSRSVGASARFSTDAGPAVRLSLEHRNLYGRNETLTGVLEADAETQELGVGLRLPQYLRPGQDLTGAASLSNTESDSFDELAAELRVTLSREVNDRLTLSAGADARVSELVDDDFEGTVLIAGAPLRASYDASDDTLDPREGFRLDLQAKPVVGLLGEEQVSYFTLDARASAYVPFDDAKKWVLAGRGRFGSVISQQFRFVPASDRLYSGGGASVRGYGEDEIGGVDEDGAPEGGRSVVEAGLELRGPIFGPVGFALFAEAGAVSDDPAPGFENDIQAAAGVGVRVATPVGPVRVDVAAPIERRERHDEFQVYFSIGQAF